MSEINIPRAEQEAIKAIDCDALSSLIDQCLNDGDLSALQPCRLDCCGLFVAVKLRAFERTLSEYRKAKAPKKLAYTQTDAHRAGSDLLDAVHQMKSRVKTEEKQAEFFYVDDLIPPPSGFTEHLTVRVYYRWRPSTDSEWMRESIEFTYTADLQPDYLCPLPARRKSARQQAMDRQNKLYAKWEFLKFQALCSVRDYFQDGGDGAAIPRAFRVEADAYTGEMSNFSARFWVV